MVHSFGFGSLEDWKSYVKSGKMPGRIRSDPSYVYMNKWKSGGDWLGTGYIAPQNRVYRSYEGWTQYLGLVGYSAANKLAP